MRHATALDAHEVELRRAKQYLDEYAARPDRWVSVRLMRRVLKTGFAMIRELEQSAGDGDHATANEGSIAKDGEAPSSDDLGISSRVVRTANERKPSIDVANQID
jgi:hypothetical protein